jgi:uracil-DNA glycosylase family 4
MTDLPAFSVAEPPRDCPLCPRLVALREDLKGRHPDWFDAPVPAFGDGAGRLLILGLAPGLNGANRTGRPFTGDYAGVLLYETLIAEGFAKGRYEARPDDGVTLQDCLIVNALRCLPPANKPEGAELGNCRPFLAAQMAAMPNLKVILALGRIAHDAALAAFGERRARYAFGHGARHVLSNGLTLIDSYHCSRYNTQTRRLTPQMFTAVMRQARAELG